jgi:Glutaredoxin-like domain (DUF836)
MNVTLYSKPDCQLCSELKADLLSMQGEIGFILVERNILDDAQDFARYQALIPVLDIEGGALLYPPHDWLQVYNALKAAEKVQPQAHSRRIQAFDNV